MKRRIKMNANPLHPHPTGKIGRPGEYQRRQLGSVVLGKRVLSYHATKGWRNRRA